MDWTTFFKDNSQSLFTLGGVFFGSLITIFISYFNNRFQAQERDKDREEERREVQMQAREKWMERDILHLMDSVEKILNLLSDQLSLSNRIDSFGRLQESGLLTQDELNTRLKSYYDNIEHSEGEINRISDTISKLAYSFDDEILSSCSDFLAARIKYVVRAHEYRQKKRHKEVLDTDEFGADWVAVKVTAGRLQKVLREKLISIRDS